MKKEYDFSQGVRGKFYKANARLNLPVYLDDDVLKFVQEFAKRKKVDTQTIVNTLLRSNKDIVQTLQEGKIVRIHQHRNHSLPRY